MARKRRLDSPINPILDSPIENLFKLFTKKKVIWIHMYQISLSSHDIDFYLEIDEISTHEYLINDVLYLHIKNF